MIIVDAKRKEKQRLAIDEALSNRSDFTESKVITGVDPIFYLASDETRNMVFYVYENEKLLFDYNDVVSVDIIEDGQVIVSKKSVAGTIGGAVVGGVLAGGVGAIIGGTSGKSTSQKRISTLKVHILLRNNDKQSFDIVCFEGGETMAKSVYQMSFPVGADKAQEVFDFFKLIIDKAHRDNNLINNNQVVEEPVMEKKAPLVELKELAELKKQGLITEEEYVKMKSKIIG